MTVGEGPPGTPSRGGLVGNKVCHVAGGAIPEEAQKERLYPSCARDRGGISEATGWGATGEGRSAQKGHP